MKRLFLMATLIAGSVISIYAQKYTTTTGKVSFFSSASMEDITANNNQVTAAVNAETGELAFVVLIQSFEFDIALMQTHFNENYMESTKFPKATFVGSISNNSAVNYTVDGTYNVNVSGSLSIHGVTKTVSTTGTITVKGNQVTAKCTFDVVLADYGIKNDKKDNIANTIAITVNATMTKK